MKLYRFHLLLSFQEKMKKLSWRFLRIVSILGNVLTITAEETGHSRAPFVPNRM